MLVQHIKEWVDGGGKNTLRLWRKGGQEVEKVSHEIREYRGIVGLVAGEKSKNFL